MTPFIHYRRMFASAVDRFPSFPLGLLLCLPWIGVSCSSSSHGIKGVPANLPSVAIHGSSATPPHNMSHDEYPFDANGNYMTNWVADAERRAGRGAAMDYDSWRSSHGGASSSSRTRSSSSSGTRKTTSNSSSRSPSSKSKSSSGTRYTIKKGDTLSGIARKYGTTVSKIKAANGMKSDFIREGRTLTIPR